MRRRPSSGRLERRGIRAFQSYVSSPAALAIATLVGDVVLVGMPSCFMPDLGGACSSGVRCWSPGLCLRQRRATRSTECVRCEVGRSREQL